VGGAPGIVATRSGQLRGVERDGTWEFLGVRYAAPARGMMRFRPPRPPEPWSGVRDANEYGPVAPQPSAGAGYIPNDPALADEDCCSLNVYTPACDDGRRPVMVFVHGGGFLGGAGSSAMYRGTGLVRAGVVLVTINYRLGALGFLAHPCLAGTGSDGFGNWGLWDQVAALRWVREHIAGFGGDPGRVTLFGESAGAMSVADLVGAPASRGLFARAVLQSGAALASAPAPAAAVAEQLAALLGLPEPSREHLSRVPQDELLAAQAELSSRIDRGFGMPFQPVVDGGLLPRHPAETVAAGGAAGVELLAGTNRDEFRFFSFSIPDLDELDEERVRHIVGSYLSGAGVDPARLPADEVVEAYRAARLGRQAEVSPRELLEAIAGDWLFRLPVTRLLDAHRAAGGRGYCYLFDWESPFAGGALRSCHGLELPFVFGTWSHPVIGLFAGTGEDAARLSRSMAAAWAAFAGAGDPSCDEVGHWPAYASPARETMVLGRNVHVERAPFDEERTFFDSRLGRYGVQGPIEGAEPRSVALLLEAMAPPGGAVGAARSARASRRASSGSGTASGGDRPGT
jgi:para-nitrobenzyl esterase